MGSKKHKLETLEDGYNKLIHASLKLKAQYEQLVIKIDDAEDKASVTSSLPKMSSPFMDMSFSLKEMQVKLNELKDEIIKDEIIAFKTKRHKYSQLALNSTEEKSLMYKHPDVMKLSSMCEIINIHISFHSSAFEMLSKYNFNITNWLRFKELMG